MGYQQGQGCVVGGRAAWPSLAGGQLLDLAGGGVGAGAGPAFPRHAERVAAGIGGQSAVDAPGKVEDFLRVHHAQQAVTHDLHRRTRQCPLLYRQAFLPGCERGSAQRDPGLGDVVAGARLGEGLQGAGGEFPGAAGVAVAQQELGARVPYLRAFPGFAGAFRELLGLGEAAFGFAAAACAEPCSSQRVQALQDAAGVGDLTPQPERLTVMMLGCGPFLPDLGDAADVREDRAVDHAVAVGFGQCLQQFQRVTESRFGVLDIAAEVFCCGYDAVTAGTQVGIRCAAQVESRAPVTLCLTEIAEVKRDIREAYEYVYPLCGAAYKRHLSFSLSAVKIPPHERELRTKQANTTVLHWEK